MKRYECYLQCDECGRRTRSYECPPLRVWWKDWADQHGLAITEGRDTHTLLFCPHCLQRAFGKMCKKKGIEYPRDEDGNTFHNISNHFWIGYHGLDRSSISFEFVEEWREMLLDQGVDPYSAEMNNPDYLQPVK